MLYHVYKHTQILHSASGQRLVVTEVYEDHIVAVNFHHEDDVHEILLTDFAEYEMAPPAKFEDLSW